MAFNENRASIIPDENRKVKWTKPDQGWATPVKEIYNSAKNNTYSIFLEQSDIAVFWALCDMHSRMLATMIEPNAAVLKYIFDSYERFNLTIRGRVNSQLTIAPKQEVVISDEQVDILVDRIRNGIVHHDEETIVNEGGFDDE